MKTKIMYLFLMASLSISACSPVSPGTISPLSTEVQSSASPIVQMMEASSVAKPASDARPGKPGDQPTPPEEAIAACTDKVEQDTCEFSSPRGLETGFCEMVQSQLACFPKRGPDTGRQGNEKGSQAGGDQASGTASAYNTEQAISDKAQGKTIAFDALAFLTGDLGAASFFPPGKVADFWGFQFLRDNDPSQMGHAGDFLTSAAMNMLNILTADQRAQLVRLAESQVSAINEYGYKRFGLIKAFQRLLNDDLPEGTTGLDEEAVKAYSGALFQLDGEISFERAQLMGDLIRAMDPSQLASLEALKGKGMLEWPTMNEPFDIQGLDRDVKVALMTYAADMLSWYLGSLDADVYFCPERHGTYFGSFYLKDIKAMSDPSYAIPTNMTGDLGDEMLSLLVPDQAELITGLVDIQRPSLHGIVDIRRQISIELRKFLSGETADQATVLSMMEQYGELDGEISYNLANNFTKVSQTLTSEQKEKLDGLRQELLGDLSQPSGAYLYSQAIPMLEIPETDFLFK